MLLFVVSYLNVVAHTRSGTGWIILSFFCRSSGPVCCWHLRYFDGHDITRNSVHGMPIFSFEPWYIIVQAFSCHVVVYCFVSLLWLWLCIWALGVWVFVISADQERSVWFNFWWFLFNVLRVVCIVQYLVLKCCLMYCGILCWNFVFACMLFVAAHWLMFRLVVPVPTAMWRGKRRKRQLVWYVVFPLARLLQCLCGSLGLVFELSVLIFYFFLF